MQFKFRYYYNHLSDSDQKLYDLIYTAVKNIDNNVNIPVVDNKKINSLYDKIKLDCPELFYFVGFSIRKIYGNMHILFIPKYMFEKKCIIENAKALDVRINKILKKFDGRTDFDKEKQIHDFICTNIKYDKLKKNYSHEIIGPLTHGIGVCDGISKTVKLLCDCLGIECIIALSDSDRDKGIKYRHAWNLIKINNCFVHLDVTFDNSLSLRSNFIRYDYFNLCKREIYTDHLKVLYEIPDSSVSGSYYKKTGVAFTKENEISKCIESSLRKGKDHVVIQWSGSFFNGNAKDIIYNLSRKEAAKRNYGIEMRINNSQSVFVFIFIKNGCDVIESDNIDQEEFE